MASSDPDVVLTAEEEEKLIAQALGDNDGSLGGLLTFAADVGEKAEDAVDYADIGDDDLADDEDLMDVDSGNNADLAAVPDEGGLEDDNLDDLFGDGQPSSPVGEPSQPDNLPVPSDANMNELNTLENKEDPLEEDDPEWNRDHWLLQQRLFQQARERVEGDHEDPIYVPPSEETRLILEEHYPNYNPHEPVKYLKVLKKRLVKHYGRVPLKPPKAVVPTKVNSAVEIDHEKLFSMPDDAAAAQVRKQYDPEASRLVPTNDVILEEESDEEDMLLQPYESGADDDEMIGNTTLADLRIACVDWEVPSLESLETLSDDDSFTAPLWAENGDEREDHTAPPSKKRKRGYAGDFTLPAYPVIPVPAVWDDPELATALLARKPILDMNDPNLLLDTQAPTEAKQARPGRGFKRDAKGSLANPIFRRYNISNDEAYDALKENHQHKVRSTLGHMSVEHTLPAIKLQYPFYKVNLSERELRSFHRPTFTCRAGERASLSTLRYHKRKKFRHLKVAEVFQFATDLNVGDNSDLLLAEYSEEYPTTLSNFGMGTKVVNYYRRKDEEDTSRPKLDLGETAVLLPQDKSPFSLFGDVEPGEIVPAIHNAMYRAPVFKHDAKPTDFLVSRSQTGREGSKWYMRNIQNLVAVGQQFPSVEVPGVHARKVTEASKKRLKMLAFRLFRRGRDKRAKQPWVSNEMIKKHLPGTEIAQNRSRMREIMTYDKDNQTWNPKDGEVVPDEENLRTWIKPEDVCLIDSMHAGNQQLADAGFNQDQINKNDEDDDSKIELKLAPWYTTKNFLNACQGKAMLELHGEGDPTGRGEGFSFIKVSMKGGFKDVGQSVEERLDTKKDLGGHSYNVARQQKQYEEAIKRIWKKQAESLSSTLEHSDGEMDVDHIEAEQGPTRGKTPRSEFGTPAFFRDDETTSQYSRMSNKNDSGKVMRIKRRIKNDSGGWEVREEIVRDPKVWKLYKKRDLEAKVEQMDLSQLQATGDAELDAQQQAKLRKELARLMRNSERRQGREKAKGHIKTNKKLCPLLNGQKKQSDTFKDASGASPLTGVPPSASSLAASP